MGKYTKETDMEHTGQVYKFIGLKGLIRPDSWGQTRIDVLFNKHEHNFKIGDRVIYTQVEKNGRRHVATIRKA
jgi:hypothetical protein